jgi:hypothetical protein
MNSVIEKKAVEVADKLVTERVVYGIDPITIITLIIGIIVKLIELWNMFYLSYEKGLDVIRNPGMIGRVLINRVIRKNGGRLSEFSTTEIRQKLSEVAKNTTLEDFKVMTTGITR